MIGRLARIKTVVWFGFRNHLILEEFAVFLKIFITKTSADLKQNIYI